MELLRGEGEAKEAKAETTWKDGTRGEWHTRGGSYARRAIPWLQGQRKFAVARKRIWWCIVLFFSFFFFESFRLRLFPFFFWFDRLVFFFCFVVFRFFGWAGGRWFKEHGRDICNISVEFSKRDSLCVRVFGRRINSSYSDGLCPAAVSRQISLFRMIWAVAFNVNNIEGEWWFNGRQRVCNYCYEFVGTKGVFERDSEIV